MISEVVAIIPARGGSKGIRRKNLQLLGGKPLIAWPIELAKSISRIDRVVVSTEDDEIAKQAKKLGAEVPFVRPPELADDETPTLPVLQHAVEFLEEKGSKVGIVLLLYATTPFMRKDRIEEALDLFEKTDCNSVMGIQEDKGRFWKIDEVKGKYLPFYPEDRINRQYYKPLYREAGNIYFSRNEVLMTKNKVVDEEKVEFVLVEDNETIDIDTMDDLIRAKKHLEENEK